MFFPASEFAILLSLFSIVVTIIASASSSNDNENGDTIFVKINNNKNHPSIVRGLRAGDDESLSLYEYNLSLSATTPLKPSYDRCTGWPEWSNPSNFTWYGLGIQLPDDAVTSRGSYFSDVANADKADGVVQAYNITTPMVLLNYTFQTSEGSPVIRLHINGDVLWNSYEFTFADSSADLEEKEKLYGVTCTISEPDSPDSSWVGTTAVDVTLAISMYQRLVRNGTSPATSSATSIIIGTWTGSLVMVMAGVTLLSALFLG